jgi:hypothetical protein
MFATVRRYEGVTNPREAGRVVEQAFLPMLDQIPGFVAYYWVDAGGGVMFSTSIFQDRGGAEESNRRAVGLIREQLASVLPKTAQITEGEVVVHKGAIRRAA